MHGLSDTIDEVTTWLPHMKLGISTLMTQREHL